MSVMDTDASARGEFGERWWVSLLLGILAVIAGIAAILAPFVAGLVLAKVIGIALVIGGVVHAVTAVVRHRSVGRVLLGLLVAAFYVIVGLYLLYSPVVGVLALTLALGIFYVAEGIARIIAAIGARDTVNWGWELVGGILALILGIIIWSGWPGTALWVLGVIVGIDLIYFGWTLIALSTAAHTLATRGPRLAEQH